MRPTIDEIFRRARWHPDRQVPIDDDLAVLRADGYVVWPELEAFLREHAGLVLRHNRVVFTLGSIIPVNAQEPEFSWAYERVAGTRLAPVGFYSGMVLLLSPEGHFYGGYSELFGQMPDDIRDIAAEILYGEPGDPFQPVPEIEAWDEEWEAGRHQDQS